MAPASSPPRLHAPVFLLASERSGTNLLRAVLGSHPNIAGPTPPHLLTSFLPHLPTYGDLARDENFRLLCGHVCRILNSQLGEWKTTPDPDALFAAARRRDFWALFEHVYAQETAARGRSRCFFKENGAFRHAYRLMRQFEDAKFIYLVRDGRDFLLSFLRSSSHIGTVGTAARLWRDEQRACLALYHELAPAGRIAAVHYEDLVCFPEDTARRLCAFLGEAFTPTMLDFHRDDEHQRVAQQVDNWRNLAKPITRRGVGGYRTGLSRLEILRFEAIAGRELRLAGYRVRGRSRGGPGFATIVDRAKQGLSVLNKLSKGARISAGEFRRRLGRARLRGALAGERNRALQPLLRCRAVEERGLD